MSRPLLGLILLNPDYFQVSTVSTLHGSFFKNVSSSISHSGTLRFFFLQIRL